MPRLIGLLVLVLFSALPALAQWESQPSPTDASLRGICAVSSRVAWASGSKGTVLRTTDGGKHWETAIVPDAETLDFRDIQAFDDRTAYILSSGPGEKSRIYKTTDGGKRWRLQFTSTEAKSFYDGFAFWDRKHGIAMSDPVEGRFLLLVTEDGETWKPLIPTTLPPSLPNEGGFAASGTCIAVAGKNEAWFGTGGPAARVFHSPDRGKTWAVVTSPLGSGAAAQGIFSIAFAGRDNGLIVGGNYEQPAIGMANAAYSTDGGKTWTLAEKTPAGYRSAAAFVPGTSPLVWIAAGTSGSDYSRDGGKTWITLDSGNHNAVSFCGPHTGWSVGPKGKIARFTGLPE